MKKLRHVIAPLTLGLMLAGPAGCKYTGGDDQPDQEQQAENALQADQAGDRAAPSDESLQRVQPDSPAEDSGLGEGTDEQRALMARAKQAFLSEQLDRAEVMFEELAKTEPISGPQVSGAIALAQIYNETDRPQKAIELYDRLADRVDDVAEVQIVIARAYAEQGETGRAVEAYEKLLDLQPDYVFAWLELGKLHSRADREEQATQALYKYEKRVYSLAKKLEDADTDLSERLHIVDVFSLVSDDRASEALVKVMGDKQPKVRQRAATVLGETGAAEAREVLEEASVNDPHLGVRMAAKDALGRLDELGDDGGGQIGPSFVGDEAELPR